MLIKQLSSKSVTTDTYIAQAMLVYQEVRKSALS